jgi:hypothetical protein
MTEQVEVQPVMCNTERSLGSTPLGASATDLEAMTDWSIYFCDVLFARLDERDFKLRG